MILLMAYYHYRIIHVCMCDMYVLYLGSPRVFRGFFMTTAVGSGGGGVACFASPSSMLNLKPLRDVPPPPSSQVAMHSIHR